MLTGCSFNGVVSLYAGAGAGGSIGLGSGVLIMTGTCETEPGLWDWISIVHPSTNVGPNPRYLVAQILRRLKSRQ